MKLTTIASGSSGNCYVIDNGKDILLLDAGVKIAEILKGVERFKNVVGCFLTHEHGDHAAGVKELAARGVTIYTAQGTIGALGTIPTANRLHAVQAKKTFRVGTYEVMPFDVKHDAAEPLGFVVRDMTTMETLLFATDTWYLRYRFPGVNYWLIECNFISEIADAQADAGDITQGLSERVRTSHMSLEMLKETLRANDLSKTHKICLLHLSDSRSDEKRMCEEIEAQTGVETVALTMGKVVHLTETNF